METVNLRSRYVHKRACLLDAILVSTMAKLSEQSLKPAIELSRVVLVGAS